MKTTLDRCITVLWTVWTDKHVSQSVGGMDADIEMILCVKKKKKTTHTHPHGTFVSVVDMFPTAGYQDKTHNHLLIFSIFVDVFLDFFVISAPWILKLCTLSTRSELSFPAFPCMSAAPLHLNPAAFSLSFLEAPISLPLLP